MLTAVIPMFWFMFKRVRDSRVLSLIGAGITLVGIGLNRFDAAWFALKPVPGYSYFPSIAEIMIQVGVFSAIIFVYTLVGHYLPLFEGTLKREKVVQKETVPVASQPRTV